MRGAVLLTILLMALATYATRTLGYIALRDRRLSPRAQAVLKAIPGCVLIAVIAPYLASGRPADALALAAVALTATRLPLLPVVLIAIAAGGILRHVL